ncbi:MAG: hypothetical protein GYB67_01440 [Chloroflexi bacterium]|nr:hypothetical protein [Chloroflexota bacterium]
MSWIENYIHLMPKVELHVQLEGAVRAATLLMIAEQNEIAEGLKHFDTWVDLLQNPQPDRIDELVRMINSWLHHAEDLTRSVYDVGVVLAKQNVRYAEISVNPALYPEIELTPDEFLEALNDGRERARRAWGVEMAWILTIPRDEPRRADEVARWAASVTGRKGGIVGICLSGREDAQPAGQFERAFKMAEKKSVPTVVRAGHDFGLEGVIEALDTFNPRRLVDAWGIVESGEVLQRLVDHQVSVMINIARAQAHGWVQNVAEYPLRRLYDEEVTAVIGADMPTLYQTSLNDEYLAAVEKCQLSVEELEDVALNAVRASFLPEDQKAALLADFQQEYERIRTRDEDDAGEAAAAAEEQDTPQ